MAVLREPGASWGRGNRLQEASRPLLRSFPERSWIIRLVSVKVSYTRTALGGCQGIGNCLGFWETDKEELTIHQLGIEEWKWGKSRPWEARFIQDLPLPPVLLPIYHICKQNHRGWRVLAPTLATWKSPSYWMLFSLPWGRSSRQGRNSSFLLDPWFLKHVDFKKHTGHH